MPGPILHMGAVITCPHAAPVAPVTANTRVLVNTMPALVVTDTFPITGCPFQVPAGTGTKPQPCVRVRWTVPSARVLVNGQPVLLAASVGICVSAEQIPQGSAMPSGVQPRVVAQ